MTPPVPMDLLARVSEIDRLAQEIDAAFARRQRMMAGLRAGCLLACILWAAILVLAAVVLIT